MDRPDFDANGDEEESNALPPGAVLGEGRVLLTLDGRAICAKRFRYIHDCVIQVECEDDETESYSAGIDPTFADVFGVPEDATYEEAKQKVLEATGWIYPEECMWLAVDEQGNAVPGTDTYETLTNWLKSPITSADVDIYVALCREWTKWNASKYTPGFRLLEELPEQEHRRLGLTLEKSSFEPWVSTTASIRDLNEVLGKYELQYVFVDDAGPEPEGFW